MPTRNEDARCENCTFWIVSANDPNFGSCRRWPIPQGQNYGETSECPRTPKNRFCAEHPDFFLGQEQ